MQNTFLRSSICILVAISCFSLLTVASYADKAETNTVKPINLSELKGKISSNKGKVVLVNYWATWCPYCVKGVPGFTNLYKKYKDKGLEIIGVSLDRGGIPVVQPFVKKHGINYPIFLGNAKEIKQEYGITGYPTTFIIGKDGETKSKLVGYRPVQAVEKEILALLK